MKRFALLLFYVLLAVASVAADPNVVLTNYQKVRLDLHPVDADGRPALLDGFPVWTVSGSTGIVTLEVDSGGMGGWVITVGPVGVVTVTVQADGDTGPGVAPLAASLVIQVVSSQAVALGLTAGTPMPR